MIAYVVGPYRAADNWQVARNIEAARNCAGWLWEHGYAVICPHTNTAMFHVLFHTPEENYLNGYLEILPHCDLIVMLPGWTNSSGSKNEFILAKQHGIQQFYWPVDKDLLEEHIKEKSDE